ncbi:MAG: hypothetical protein WCJ33_04065 [Pseudomonadota bacterium]
MIHKLEILDSGVYLPEVIDVDYLGNHLLNLIFDDGKAGKIDLSEWVKTHYDGKLQDEYEFIQFGLENGTLVWKNNIPLMFQKLFFFET